MLREASRFFEGQIPKGLLEPKHGDVRAEARGHSAKVAKKFAHFAAADLCPQARKMQDMVKGLSDEDIVNG